jgi:hypothetical protein
VAKVGSKSNLAKMLMPEGLRSKSNLAKMLMPEGLLSNQKMT